MPVVAFTFDRLNKLLPGKKLDDLLKIIPFIGVDIEGVDNAALRIEYNPNRPDFASDYGIARAVKGLLGIENGIPEFKLSGRSGCTIKVGISTRQIRPYIISLVAKNGKLDDETIRQLIALQEDLQNVIGRRRIKASIGIHNLDAIKFPVTYMTVQEDFSFIPLGSSANHTIRHILKELDVGKQYAFILEKSDAYPIIQDAENNVLSFPPIVNSNLTRIDTGTKNLFVEVTGNNLKVAEDVLSVMAMSLYDAGFEIQTVSTHDSDGRMKETPKMDPSYIKVEPSYINRILGLNLKVTDILKCLKKSRLDGKAMSGKIIECTIPRYRTDIIDGTDLIEEVAVGYGIYNLRPTIPSSDLSGKRSYLSVCLDIVREAMTGLGVIEVVNFNLVSRKVHYQLMGIPEHENILMAEKTKSIEHEILRESLTPSLTQTLSHNIHEEYPQKIFEVGKVFQRGDRIKEYWNLGVLVAHSKANYTEGKSIVQTLLKTSFGKDIVTKSSINAILVQGRASNIMVDGLSVGYIGEIKPLITDNFKLRVPVVAAELNLSQIMSFS
ncbi:MAG TPA: phenylalanine--tRNA ligase subunit beta [Candidatus Nitrosopolaris sp.]|nr:phenylalanine--tRNA ligase subunit beta [Candidatus Nitrosopolaris sp.]